MPIAHYIIFKHLKLLLQDIIITHLKLLLLQQIEQLTSNSNNTINPTTYQ